MTIWVQTNRRPFLAVLIVAVILAGGLCATATFVAAQWLWWIIGPIAVILALYAMWLLVQLLSPRVALAGSELRVFLTATGSIAIPLEHVEAFLLGQGPAAHHSRVEATTLSIRLAERAVEFQQRSVLRLLGSWCGGYITIRGTWTEPLTLELVNRLNANLAKAKKQNESLSELATT